MTMTFDNDRWPRVNGLASRPCVRKHAEVALRAGHAQGLDRDDLTALAGFMFAAAANTGLYYRSLS